MKKSIYNTPVFRYIFEIIVIVFSVTLSFYIQDVLNDREKIELKNIGLKAVLTDLERDKEFYTNGISRMNLTQAYIDSLTNNDIIPTNKIVEWGAMRYFGFLGQDRNYNSMISTGSIEFINNKELAVINIGKVSINGRREGLCRCRGHRKGKQEIRGKSSSCDTRLEFFFSSFQISFTFECKKKYENLSTSLK